MINKFKQRFFKLISALKFQKRIGLQISENENIDPRTTGLRDMVRQGWYHPDGELFKGFKITADDVVLDSGCGNGGAILYCARQGAHVVFSDIDHVKIDALISEVRQTRARKVEGIVSDTLPLPLPDQYATKILSMEMLEHTKDPALVLQELVRVGKPGARYFLTVPDSRSELLQKPVVDQIYFSEPNHIQLFDKDRFINLVENSGLKIEHYYSWGFFWTVYWSMYWVVRRNQQKQSDGSLWDEIKPPYHPVLQNWSNTWAGLMELNGSEKLMESFDKYLPKSQMIIAVKS